MKALFLFLLSFPLIAFAQEKDKMPLQREPVYQLKRGYAKAANSTSPLLSYLGGNVLQTTNTFVIFWGTQWSDSTFAADKITGLDQFFSGFSNSRYASTTTEYFDSINGYIAPYSSYNGHAFDLTAAPTSALSVSNAVAEVCKMTNNAPAPNGVYFIYTSTGAGQVNYCAWHSWGNCSNGAKVQVAYMPNIDKIAGCDPADNYSGHSQGLSALANVTAHELMEVITDPRGKGWMDQKGLENGDKCAWIFPPGNGLSMFSNGTSWKLQTEWSNQAYSSSVGLSNSNGQKGCIY